MNKTQETIKDVLKQDHDLAGLMIRLNAFVSIRDAEAITTLDKTTQYRMRIRGKFPPLVTISSEGRRKGYRIADMKEWLKDPENYRSL